jgi:hypothetical protein
MKILNQSLQRALVGIGLLGSALASLAAGSVEYELRVERDTGRMSIDWLDSNRMRMETALPGMPAGSKAWQVLRDGHLYSVQVHEGQTMVMEMSGAMKMLGSLLPKGAISPGVGDVEDFYSLKPTGRRETVAGISGEVFILDYRPEGGKREQVEVVLSDHRTVREMTQAMHSYAQAVLRAMGTEVKPGSDKLESELGQRQLGMLRFGDQFKAVRVSSQAPAASRFELPAEPMSMPQIPGLAGVKGGRLARDQAVGGAVQRQLERQQDRVNDRVQSETDAAVDKAVEKAIGRALDRLFGR